MSGETLAIRVSAEERIDLERTAERDGTSVSDYVRMRLGLRPLGNEAAEAVTEARAASAEDRLDDHERRLLALERRS